MKKNYIEPTSKCIELEAEELLQISKTEKAAITPLSMDSKSRSNYEHEDLGWDY